MHKKEMPHGGTQGKEKGLVKRFVSWLECFTEQADSQELIMLAAILAGSVLL